MKSTATLISLAIIALATAYVNLMGERADLWTQRLNDLSDIPPVSNVSVRPGGCGFSFGETISFTVAADADRESMDLVICRSRDGTMKARRFDD